MPMLTGGYLSKLVLLASAIADGAVCGVGDLARLRFVRPEEYEFLCQLAKETGILDITEPFRLCGRGQQIVDVYATTGACVEPFRILLAEYIRNTLPLWAFRIPTGRAETTAALPGDVVNCFFSARLLDSHPDITAIHWWQDMSSFIRRKIGETKVETGTEGEQASLAFEEHRTGLRPKWVSFESNFAGYDILSVAGPDNPHPRPIEVKASRQSLEDATFFVSENEWNTALCHPDSYRFHLWMLGETPQLADVPASDVAPHIPANRQSGAWKSVEIPFRTFAPYFFCLSPFDSP